jgi:hypothetical protein
MQLPSDRDGTRCIWALKIDPATRRAAGAPFAAHHVHEVRNSLEPLDNVAAVGLSVAGGQMFDAGFALQSNIWLAERREPAAKR